MHLFLLVLLPPIFIKVPTNLEMGILNSQLREDFVGGNDDINVQNFAATQKFIGLHSS